MDGRYNASLNASLLSFWKKRCCLFRFKSVENSHPCSKLLKIHNFFSHGLVLYSKKVIFPTKASRID